MCAVFGFLDYKSKISNTILKKLIQNLSIAAEVRGTDATGISYANHGKVVTFKKAKPAHKVKLYFPKNTITTTIPLMEDVAWKHLLLHITVCCTMMLN